MKPNDRLVKSYAVSIFFVGSKSLSNVEALYPLYAEPIMRHAASHYYMDDIDNALRDKKITAKQHMDIRDMKSKKDPQYRSGASVLASIDNVAGIFTKVITMFKRK